MTEVRTAPAAGADSGDRRTVSDRFRRMRRAGSSMSLWYSRPQLAIGKRTQTMRRAAVALSVPSRRGAVADPVRFCHN